MKFLLFITASILISSCAIHHGSINSNISDKPICYQDVAYGSASTNYFLGIGGLSKTRLVTKAKQNLFYNRPLNKGEQYANISVDVKTSYFLVYWKNLVTVTADVVTICSNDDDPFSESYRNFINPKDQSATSKSDDNSSESNFCTVGDSVYYYNGFDKMLNGTVSMVSEKTIEIKINNQTKLTNISNVYLPKGTRKNVTVGDSYPYIKTSNGTSKKVMGTIIGLGKTKFLISGESDYLATAPYPTK